MSQVPDENEVTRLLRATAASERGAAEQLLAVVYGELRQIAQRRMRGERAGHTLQATALVHEAYLRLIGTGPPSWRSRSHFFLAAAEAMRKILIDHARRRGADKRGGKHRRIADIQCVVDLAADENLADSLALDEALSRLEKEDPAAAGIVRLRFFAGLSGDEAAEVLGISPRQADREWAYAKAYLLRSLQAFDACESG